MSSWITWNPHPYGDSTGSDNNNSAQSSSNGSSGFLPWLMGTIASNATGSSILGSAVSSITALQQAYHHTDLHQQMNQLPYSEQVMADFGIMGALANEVGNEALDLVGIPEVDKGPDRLGLGVSSGSGKVPGKSPGKSPYVNPNQDIGLAADGSAANSGETPFQDAGFGSEYDFAYNLMHKLAQENNEWSAAQAQAQMDFQERMSSTAHQREVADLQAAGLNPVLSAGGSGASTPSGSMGSVDTSATRTVAELALHAIDGLANTAQGIAGVHSQAQNDNSFWGRLNNFYTSNKLGHDLIYNVMSFLGRLPSTFR